MRVAPSPRMPECHLMRIVMLRRQACAARSSAMPRDYAELRATALARQTLFSARDSMLLVACAFSFAISYYV